MKKFEKPESIKKTDPTKKKVGGARPGAGRKPKAKHLSNYEHALKLLDDNFENILQPLLVGLKDKDKIHAVRCAEILFKKVMPDKIDLSSSKGLQVLYLDKQDKGL